MISCRLLLIVVTLLGTTFASSPHASAQVQGKKWNPGHYIRPPYCNGFASEAHASCRRMVYDLIADDSRFVGASHAAAWGQLEPQKGVYDFSQIDADLAYLKSIGKRMVIEIWWGKPNSDEEFIGESGDRWFADWMIEEGGVRAQNGGFVMRLDDAYWMERYVRLHEALAARYDDEDYVEQIATGETAYASAYEWLWSVPQIAAAWKHTAVILWMNWVDRPELARDLMAIAAANGVGIGGPDTLPAKPIGPDGEDHGSLALRGAGWGDHWSGPGDYGSIDYRGQVPVSYEYQALHDIPPSMLVSHLRDTRRELWDPRRRHVVSPRSDLRWRDLADLCRRRAR